MIRFFDAHCDTVKKVADREANFITGDGAPHISLPAMLEAGACVQVFACWVFSENYPGQERERAEELVRTANEMCEQSGGKVQIALTGDHIRKGCAGEGARAVLALEGADPLEGKAENLAHFKNLGIREVIIAWGDNAFSGTVFGSGSGLTDEGARLIETAEELGVLLDVSHLSDRAFDDFCGVAKKPFIASHSNCRAVCPSPRNLTDAMIRTMAERGGVIGINLSSGFLAPDFFEQEWAVLSRFLSIPKENTEEFNQGLKDYEETIQSLSRPSKDWILEHIKHLIRVGGEDCVGLGGDLDGVPSLPDGIDGIISYPVIADLLTAGGLKTEQVEKACWKNFERVFVDTLA